MNSGTARFTADRIQLFLVVSNHFISKSSFCKFLIPSGDMPNCRRGRKGPATRDDPDEGMTAQ